MCLCAWIAFFIQSIELGMATDWEYFEGTLICCIMFFIIVVGATSWQYYQIIAERFADNKNGIRDGLTEEDIRKHVTSLTYKCISSEAAFLSVPAFSVAGWLLQYGYCRHLDCNS